MRGLCHMVARDNTAGQQAHRYVLTFILPSSRILNNWHDIHLTASSERVDAAGVVGNTGVGVQVPVARALGEDSRGKHDRRDPEDASARATEAGCRSGDG